MRTVEEQLQAMLAATHALESLELPLVDATGCVLATDITAVHPVPPFDAAAIAGYAVRAQDLISSSYVSPTSLEVIDDVPAGHVADKEVIANTAVKIAQGALMPKGADAVVAVNQVTSVSGDPESDRKDHINVSGPVGAGAGMDRAGHRMAAGEVALSAGTELGIAATGVAVASGRSRVSVYPHPRVVILTVGSELVDIGTPLQPGLVHDSRAVMLVGAAARAGAHAFRGGPARSDALDIASRLDDQLVRSDLVVISGGTASESPDSSGPLGLALEALGCTDFELAHLEPGPVVGFGTIGPNAIPVIAIPPDPGSALIAFEVFVRPIIRRLAGREGYFRPVVRAQSTGEIETTGGRRAFVPARVSLDESTGTTIVLAEPRGGEDRLSGWSTQENALIIVPETVTRIHPGDVVAAIRLDR